MNRILSLFVAILAITTPGCAPSPEEMRLALGKADVIELYSLEPNRGKLHAEDKSFNSWEILGQTTIKDEETRKKLVDAFEKGVKDSTGVAMACFNPRHAIRVTHNKKTLDFVICFECLRVWTFVDGKQENAFCITATPQKCSTVC